VPHAIGLQEKYGAKGLKVILVHCQESSDLPAFMMKMFPANEAMVTADNPVPIGTTQGFRLPRAALVGVDGKVLADGLRAKVGGTIDKLIPLELKRMKKGWGAHPDLTKARALLYGKGDLAGARALAQRFSAAPAQRDDHDSLRREVEIRFERLLGAVEYWTAAGEWLKARAAGERLAKGVEGVRAWEAKVAKAREAFSGPGAKTELALAKKILKIVKAIRKSGPKEKHLKALSNLARKDPESRAGKRAKRLAQLVRRSLDL
jgi:hypothetical protein